MPLTQKTSRKKSSESMVQPRKAASNVRLWAGLSRRKSFRTYIYARIAGPMDQGTEYRTLTSFSKAGLLEPDNNCCNKSQSISIEFYGGFREEDSPLFFIHR